MKFFWILKISMVEKKIEIFYNSNKYRKNIKKSKAKASKKMSEIKVEYEKCANACYNKEYCFDIKKWFNCNHYQCIRTTIVLQRCIWCCNNNQVIPFKKRCNRCQGLITDGCEFKCKYDIDDENDESPCQCEYCGKIHPFSECEDEEEWFEIVIANKKK